MENRDLLLDASADLLRSQLNRGGSVAAEALKYLSGGTAMCSAGTKAFALARRTKASRSAISAKRTHGILEPKKER